MSEHKIKLLDNISVKPKGWGWGDNDEFPFEHLTGVGKAFFVPLHESASKKDAEALKRRIYNRATHTGHRIEVRRGKDDGLKGYHVHFKAEPIKE